MRQANSGPGSYQLTIPQLPNVNDGIGRLRTPGDYDPNSPLAVQLRSAPMDLHLYDVFARGNSSQSGMEDFEI
jgi:hypothetical protein